MFFYSSLKLFGGRTAVITDTGLRVTYEELDAWADALYSKINHRSLLFCFCENSLGSLVGYVSCLKNNMVPLLIDKDLDGGFLRGLLDAYKPEYLYLPDAMVDRFLDFEVAGTGHGYTLVNTNYSEKYPLFEELALLLTTSGSTGSPKLVRQSYRNIEANAKAIAQYLKIDQNERPITTLPMSYTYGLSIINSHLLIGATLLLTAKSFMEKRFWQFFREMRATSFGGVPYIYEMLKKLRFFSMNLPSLRTMTQAGGKLTPELTREFAEFAQMKGLRFFVMYGQTEATARMSYLPPEYALLKCGSMGVAIPGGAFSLIDDNRNVIETPNTVGELVYKGPNVAMGYAECGADLARGDDWGGVLVTGDMAERDTDGFYYITGRKKRFIKIFGNRINLDEAERLLKTIVTDCACAGEDDHMEIYITRQGMEKEVQGFIASKTGINPVAFNVIQLDRIPKNEAGKTMYTALRMPG
jgi:acyl-coenzyme A synthetase/AMP-(fatty) acid ligase